MTSRSVRMLLAVVLAALSAPAAAAASAGTPAALPDVDVTSGSQSAAAASSDPGCRSKSLIAFKGSPESLVRQAARVRCRDVRVWTRCNARLLQGGQRIARERSAGPQRCRAATPYSSSERYPAGTEFTQRYRFKLTLRNRNQRWTGTTDDCPKRSKNKRTLTCRGSHTTTAPQKSVDRITS